MILQDILRELSGKMPSRSGSHQYTLLVLGWLYLVPYNEGKDICYCVKPTKSGRKRSEIASNCSCETLEYYVYHAGPSVYRLFPNHSSGYVTITSL